MLKSPRWFLDKTQMGRTGNFGWLELSPNTTNAKNPVDYLLKLNHGSRISKHTFLPTRPRPTRVFENYTR